MVFLKHRQRLKYHTLKPHLNVHGRDHDDHGHGHVHHHGRDYDYVNEFLLLQVQLFHLLLLSLHSLLILKFLDYLYR